MTSDLPAPGDEELETESSSETYSVGPGRPPLGSRWKKGDPSPNKKGRPRKDASLKTDFKKIFEEALNKKVKVKRGETHVELSRFSIGIEQLFNQFASGDRHALQSLMDMAEKLGIDLLSGQKDKIEEILSPSQDAILEAYFSRLPRPADPAPAERVLAPPELRNDKPVTKRPLPPPRPSKPDPS